MMKSLLGLTVILGALMMAAAAPQDLDGIKCVVMGGKAAKADKSVEYKDGNVYFCCDRCVASFKGDPEKFAIKANHQLVLTGQYVQTACPFSGGKIAEGMTTDVGGAEVGFCCGNCKGKVEKAESVEAKAEMVFANTAFAKGFAEAGDHQDEEVDLSKVNCFFMTKKTINPAKFAEFGEGKVYFCCDNCLNRFKKAPETYAAKANHQLVRTGQYVQTGCPFSGGEVDKDTMIEVNGVKVGFCCGDCQAKAEGAEDDDARAEMLFGKDSFAKGFAKKESK